MDKKTKKIIKKHLYFCLRHKGFKTTIFIQNDDDRQKVIDYIEFLRCNYDGSILYVKNNKTSSYCYTIEFRNGSFLAVSKPVESVRGNRHNSVIIDENISRLFMQNVIYPKLRPRMIYVPYWVERIVKVVDGSKTYPHSAKTKSLIKYVDYIKF